jgi:hypothetical protein
MSPRSRRRPGGPMTVEVLARGVRRGDAVFGDMRLGSATTSPTPATYATLVAEDRHLASECAQLTTVGATALALDIVSQAAERILAQSDGMVVITPTRRSEPFGEALRNIETVARRYEEQGDEVQATWCSLLHHKLVAMGYRTS